MTARDIVMSSAGNAGDSKTYIEDVFSTYLYTGNGSTQTINNGIDLAGKGGLVWCKNRVTTNDHVLQDTVTGIGNVLFSNLTLAQIAGVNVVSSANSNGFSLNFSNYANQSGSPTVSWTFRKAPKFFDVVTYTGDGTNDRVIQHSLGVKPGMFIVKAINQANSWYVYHRSLTETTSDYVNYFVNNLWLNSTSNEFDARYWAGHNSQTSASIKFGSMNQGNINQSGIQYVIYLFAHDTTTDGLIQCGSWTAGSGTTNITLGWEPQYILFKRADSTGNWFVVDNMRGASETSQSYLLANLSDAESTNPNPPGYPCPTATGFKTTIAGGSGGQFIYMAIRRGPMRTPTDGTKVFKPVSQTPSGTTTVTTGFPVDLSWSQARNDPSWAGMNSPFDFDRLRGSSTRLNTGSTSDEYTFTNGAGIFFDSNSSIKDTLWNTNNGVTTPVIYWMFQRAPGFFDTVCYTGTGSIGRNIFHNLGKKPELLISKSRSGTGDWYVSGTILGNTGYDAYNLKLNATDAIANNQAIFSSAYWDDGYVYNTGQNASLLNASGSNYVAYLFASCPGVSKVGSYTGTGAAQNINCGFTNGARFVLIKETTVDGAWYVFDTARGITSGNDARLTLNGTGAESTSSNYLDPYSGGFSVPATGLNSVGVTHIYLAIA